MPLTLRVVLAVLCSLLIGSAALALEVGEAPVIAEIRFEGNEHLDDGALRSVMRLREPSLLRPLSTPRFPGADFLASDLNAIVQRYRDEGFPFARVTDALVRYDEKGEQVTLEITIDEGPLVRIGSIELRGVEGEAARDLRERIRDEPGSRLRDDRLEQTRQSIEGYFKDRGHALVRTEEELHFYGQQADVIYRCFPGPQVRVDSIFVEPLVRTRRGTVVRELTLEPGDLLTPKGLLESRRRLLDTGIFHSVRVQPEIADSTAGRANLRVTARERKKGWVGAGAGFSSADQLRFLAEWGLRNLGGHGRRISWNGELYYSLDPDFRAPGASFQEGLARVDYLEPRVFHTRNRATLSTYLQWLQEESFHERIVGYSFGLFREISLATRLSTAIETREVWTTEAGVRPRHTTRFVRFDAVNDRRDNPFNASIGRYLQGQVEYAGGLLGGTNEFGRISLGWHGYTSRRNWVLAGRVRAGFIEPFSNAITRVAESPSTPESLRVARVPWEERFRLGGSNTIRGYAENEVGLLNERHEAIGGLSMVLANAEVRFPLFWIVQAGLFFDAGNVWADPERFSFERVIDGITESDYDPFNLFYGAGGGLRFLTPVGPLRADYGFKLGSGREPGQNAGELHVALGQAF